METVTLPRELVALMRIRVNIDFGRRFSGFTVIVLSTLLVVSFADRPGPQRIAIYFHVVYLTLLVALALHLVLSAVLRRYRFALLVVIWAMVCLRLLSVTSVQYPILENTDSKYELQLVNNIIIKGHQELGQGTGSAVAYSYFPGLETLFSVLSIVSGLPPVIFLKYAGSFLGILTAIFFRRVYRNVSKAPSIQMVSMSFAVFSPWFVPFDTYTVHPTLGFVFLAMIFLALSEPRREWSLVTNLTLASLVITHAFGSYVACFLLSTLAVEKFRSKTSAELPNLGVSTALLSMSMVILWASFAAFNYVQLGGIALFISLFLQLLLAPELTYAPLASTGFKPLWVVIITYAGMATFGIIALSVFVRGLLRKESRGKAEKWFAMCGLFVFALTLVPYLVGLSFDTDLMPRGLTYLYFLASPLVAGYLLFSHGPKITAAGLGFHSIRRFVLITFLIFIILTPAVYYGVQPGIYEPSAPMLPTDYRLGLTQWQTAALFATQRIPTSTLGGVRLTYDFVGALADKNVERIQLQPNQTLTQWLKEHPELLVFLRLSITTTPDVGLEVSESDLRSTLRESNVLYSSGEVVLVQVS
jgi:hypothetical protein